MNINGTVMSADIPVAVVKNGMIADMNETLAPLYFRRCSDITMWLEGRAVDSHRTNSRLLKKALRLSNKDDVNTVLAVNGVTVTDNYWFKEESSELSWNDVRFKENMFDRLALYGDPDCFNQEYSRTPELTNIGSYEKCWRLIDGRWWLYKSGSGAEFFSELFIYELGKALGFNMAHYELDGGFIRTVDFTNGASVNFEAAESLVGDDENYNLSFDLFAGMSENIAADYIKLLYLDSVCMNMDRHTKNYGVLRNIATGEIISLAPNYDNNIALISRGYPKNISRENDLLIDLFIGFLKSNGKARCLFENIAIPEITEEMLLQCIKSIPIKVDENAVCTFILNGKRKICGNM